MIELGPGTILSDVFEITELIGRGATSVVWAARHRRLRQKEVAVKVLGPDYRRDVEAYERLRREAQILSQLAHPNIVQVFDFDELADGTPYLVVERLPGETLRERLRRGRLALDASVEIARQTLSALIAAHHAGVVHRDLNPRNIFLCPDAAQSTASELVKVLDFGISTLAGDETVVDPTRWIGTPEYMAPEQLKRGDRPIDARVDLFAFGAMFYEMLSGRAAFRGETSYESAMRVMNDTPESLRQLAPHVPQPLIDLIERALVKDCTLRFQTATAVNSALIRATFQPTPSRIDEQPSPASDRTKTYWAAVVAASLILGIGIAVSTQQLTSGMPVERTVVDDTGAIAVMEFENQQKDPSRAWYGRALQTAVNSELSALAQVKVVAPEEIRRVASESGVDPMDAARRLGVRRFVTGSFAVVDGAIRIDARVVDTSQGLQEVAADVEGSQGEFFTLQRQLVRTVLDRFSVKLSPEQRKTLDARPSGAVDKYRMLLEAEGVTARTSDEPQSRAWPGLGAKRLANILIRRAYAQEPPSQTESAALMVLEQYRQAHERGDAEALASLYVAFSDGQRRAVSEYARNTRELQIELANVSVEHREDGVRVSYTRRDRFVDGDSGEPMSFEVRLTKFLIPDGIQWKFAAEK